MITDFKTFLIEKELTDKDIDAFIKKVNTKCSKYLLEAKSQFVYIGLNGMKDIFSAKRPKIKQTSKVKNKKVFDDAFNEVFGLKPLLDAIAVTGKAKLATKSGDAFVIFPVGGFKYIWAPKVEELALPKYDKKGKDLDDVGLEGWVQDEYIKGKDLSKGITSGNEIYILANGFFGITYDVYTEISAGKIK